MSLTVLFGADLYLPELHSRGRVVFTDYVPKSRFYTLVISVYSHTMVDRRLAADVFRPL